MSTKNCDLHYCLSSPPVSPAMEQQASPVKGDMKKGVQEAAATMSAVNEFSLRGNDTSLDSIATQVVTYGDSGYNQSHTG